MGDVVITEDNVIWVILAVIGIITIIILFNLLERFFKKKRVSTFNISVALYAFPEDAEPEAYLTGKYAIQKIKEQGLKRVLTDPSNPKIPLLSVNIGSFSTQADELDSITACAQHYRPCGEVKKYIFSSIPHLPLEDEKTQLIHKRIMEMTNDHKRVALTVDYERH